jgi:hypothetical protein
MHPTKQPVWKYLGNLGDVHPLDYGGALVYEDKTGAYEPELVLFDGVSPCERTTVTRIVCTPCRVTDGVLSDNKFHPLHPAWFADKLPGVAETYGMDVDELTAILCSSDSLELAEGYRILSGYFGEFEFDQYPDKMTRTEIRRRYPAAFRK